MIHNHATVARLKQAVHIPKADQCFSLGKECIITFATFSKEMPAQRYNAFFKTARV
jgi:hypothetical protein